jgi:probable HAF family extracellular repeat protein
MPRLCYPRSRPALRSPSRVRPRERAHRAAPVLAALVAVAIGCGKDADFPTAPQASARSAAHRVIDLGSLTAEPGQDFSVASAINAGGSIVGQSIGTEGLLHAVRWDQGVIRDLGDLGGGSSAAVGINNRGDVVGSAWLPGTFVHAAAWDPAGRIQDLGVLPGGDYSEAIAINNRGWIVGWSNRETNPDPEVTTPDHAVLWRDGTLVPLAPDAAVSRALDINEAGVVVGLMLSGSPLRGRGFMWDRGQLTELGPPEGWDPTSAFLTSTGINARRRVVGYGSSDFAGIFEVRAILWDRAGVVDLGTLGGGTAVFPRAINNRGQIVGGLNTPPPVSQRAFLWDRGATTILPGLGDTFSEASGINASGEIVGVSGSHAVLWTTR